MASEARGAELSLELSQGLSFFCRKEETKVQSDGAEKRCGHECDKEPRWPQYPFLIGWREMCGAEGLYVIGSSCCKSIF